MLKTGAGDFYKVAQTRAGDSHLVHPDWEQNGYSDYRDVVDRLCENVMTAVRSKIDTTAISACVQREGELVSD